MELAVGAAREGVEAIAGGSMFNIAAKSLRMGGFTEAETRALTAQHTEETGQRFSPATQEAVWTQTRGQPRVVNVLCAGACFGNKAGRFRFECGRQWTYPDLVDGRGLSPGGW